MPIRRTPVGPSLVVLGGVLLFVGALLSDASRLLDPDDFANRVAESLVDPRVAEVVAEQLTDAVLTRQRDLIAYRPLILAAAKDVVASEAFRGVARTAARQAHVYLFSESARAVIVSVPDLEVVLRSALATSPGLAQAIPEDIAVGIAELPSHPALSFAVAFFRFGLDLSQYAWLALVLGTLVLIGGVLLMHDRRDALVAAGATLIFAGVGLWATLPVGSAIIGGLIQDDATQGALAGLWTVALGGVPAWGLTYAGIGVVLAAAGGSLLERFDVPELVRDARALIMAPYQRPAARLARGIALVVVGMFVVFAPRTTIAVLGVIAGLVVLFIGLREVFGVLLHASPAEERLRAAFASSREGWMVGAVLVVLLTATFGIALAVLHRSEGVSQAAIAGVDECNGSAERCDLRLDEITLAGTHNSMASADHPDWLFPQQEAGIAQQLEDGIRALMIDVHYGRPVGDRVRTEIRPGSENVATEALGPEGVAAAMRIRNRLVAGEAGKRGLYLCHGFCELGALPLDSALADIGDFMRRNPGEVVLLIVEDHVEPRDLAASFARVGLDRLVYRGDGRGPWPTLRSMIESDQRLVVLIESGRRDVPWLLPAFEVMQETPYRFLSAADTLSCAPNRGGTTGSLLLVNHWIETAPAPRPSNAEIVNAREALDERIARCERARGRRVNVVAVDFYGSGPIVRTARERAQTALPPPRGP